MRSIETSGKTVEDAVKAGLAELKCDSADVRIDVLEMGSPGLFGMFGKLARVRLTVREVVDDFSLDLPVMTLEAQKPRADKKPPEKKPEKPAQEPKDEAKPAPEDKAPKAEPAKPEKNAPEDTPQPVIKSVAEFKASRREQQPREPREQQPREPRTPIAQKEPREPRPVREPRAPREQQPREQREHREPRRRPESSVPKDNGPSVLMEELPPLDLNTLGESGKRAYDFLSNVTKLMGVEVEIRIKEEAGHLFVQMTGDALGVLIGRRGETLDSLQYLTSLQVNKGQEEYTRVSLDSEHYRAKREDALRKLASRMASRARKTGHRVALEPMNPYERRVLHSALQDNPYVTTHSEGEEPYRRVIITLK